MAGSKPKPWNPRTTGNDRRRRAPFNCPVPFAVASNGRREAVRLTPWQWWEKNRPPGY